jgi:hypothetical protein
MPIPEPLVRASHLRVSLEALALLGPDTAGAVRARLSTSARQLIEGAARTDWLPIALNAELAEAVFAVGGAGTSRRFGRELFLLSLKGFLRPLLEAVTAMFDPSPASICRFASRAWLSLYRDCGTLKLHDLGEDHLRIALVDFPEPLLRNPYLIAFAGTFEATYVLSSYEGKVEIEGAAGGGASGFLLTWTPRKGGARSPGSNA